MEEENQQKKINDIINSTNIVIPSSLLLYYIKFVDKASSKAGIVSPGDEMILLGKNYNYSVNIINQLIENKLKELENTTELKTKRKKKKKKEIKE